MSDPEQPFSGGGGLSRSAVVISSKVMVASIILLFLVVVFVMFLHLYARWFWSRRRFSEPVSRSGRHRFFISDVDPARVRSQGLDPVLIKSIPVFVYPAVSGGAGGECAVCLSEFEEGEKGRTLPQCKHSFHVDCIDMWFGTHSTCPLCRMVVTSAEVSEAEVIPVEDSARNEEEFRFPTNLLFYGEGNRVIEVNSTSSEQGSSRGGGRGRDIRIDIPARGEVRFVEEEPLPDGISPRGLAMKSPSTRLRILKRLLSRENQTPTTGCTAEAAGDVEQGRAQSSAMVSSQ